MKSILFSVAVLALSSSAVANPKPMICGYTDHLHISSNSTVKPHIVEISSTGDVKAIPIDKYSFDIVDQPSSDGCNLNSMGVVTVKYETSKTDYCTIKITDGVALDNPSDKDVQCMGHLSYLGMTYDGFFTYSYSMIFRANT